MESIKETNLEVRYMSLNKLSSKLQQETGRAWLLAIDMLQFQKGLQHGLSEHPHAVLRRCRHAPGGAPPYLQAHGRHEQIFDSTTSYGLLS